MAASMEIPRDAGLRGYVILPRWLGSGRSYVRMLCHPAHHPQDPVARCIGVYADLHSFLFIL
jgi:hypothetical protein